MTLTSVNPLLNAIQGIYSQQFEAFIHNPASGLTKKQSAVDLLTVQDIAFRNEICENHT